MSIAWQLFGRRPFGAIITDATKIVFILHLLLEPHKRKGEKGVTDTNGRELLKYYNALWGFRWKLFLQKTSNPSQAKDNALSLRSSHFWIQIRVFHLFSVKKKQQQLINGCIFIIYNFRKKYLQFPHFPINLNFNKIRDGGHIGGHFGWSHGPQQRQNPKCLPYHVEHITSYLLEVKYFRNIVTPKKPNGWFATPPPVKRLLLNPLTKFSICRLRNTNIRWPYHFSIFRNAPNVIWPYKTNHKFFINC